MWGVAVFHGLSTPHDTSLSMDSPEHENPRDAMREKVYEFLQDDMYERQPGTALLGWVLGVEWLLPSGQRVLMKLTGQPGPGPLPPYVQNGFYEDMRDHGTWDEVLDAAPGPPDSEEENDDQDDPALD